MKFLHNIGYWFWSIKHKIVKRFKKNDDKPLMMNTVYKSYGLYLYY